MFSIIYAFFLLLDFDDGHVIVQGAWKLSFTLSKKPEKNR